MSSLKLFKFLVLFALIVSNVYALCPDLSDYKGYGNFINGAENTEDIAKTVITPKIVFNPLNNIKISEIPQKRYATFILEDPKTGKDVGTFGHEIYKTTADSIEIINPQITIRKEFQGLGYANKFSEEYIYSLKDMAKATNKKVIVTSVTVPQTTKAAFRVKELNIPGVNIKIIGPKGVEIKNYNQIDEFLKSGYKGTFKVIRTISP